MRSFPVASVVRLTGLSEHVLRAWERRHRAVVPARSPGGTRRYSEGDIERLRLLAGAVAAGHGIGELAELPNAELARRGRPARDGGEPRLEALFDALGRLDAEALESQLGLQLAALGVRPFLDSVAIPFLREIGARWERGALRPHEEHAGSAALRAVLARARRPLAGADADTLVLATPAGELHDLGTLMVELCAQERGVRALQLGGDLPAAEIAEAARRTRARAVGLSIVALDPAVASREAQALRRRLPESVELWLGGAGSARLPKRLVGALPVADLSALDTRLLLLAERRAN